jgi:hypothetical protein
MNEFNTHEWRRNNIHENEIPTSSKIQNEIEEIISKYSDSINNSWGVPDDNFPDLVKDLYEYIYKNFIFKQ